MTAARELPGDWFPGSIPANVELGPGSYLATSAAFAAFHSRRAPGLRLAEGAGAYNETAFVVGPDGAVTVGPYSCLNGATIVAEQDVHIGAHVLVSWGTVITDSWPSARVSGAERRAAVLAAAGQPTRPFPMIGRPAPVVVEDGVWIGFGSVVLPGVRLGRGCVVGARSVVTEDVPPLAVTAGHPPRIVRRLAPTTTSA